MARRKKAEPLEDDEPLVDISSLIDVCFLLLIYFIVTSTIAKPETDLVLRLPSESPDSSEPPDVEAAVFRVEATGEITKIEAEGSRSALAGAGESNDEGPIHRLPSKIPELNDSIALYKSVSGDKALVQVWASPDAKSQYVIDLLNVLAKHGITKITFTRSKQ